MIENLLTQLGTTAIVIAVAGYLFRSWLSYQIQSLRSAYEHQNSIQLEAIRAEFSKDITRLGVHENYLHRRRTEIIESIFHRAVDAEFSLQSFFVGWWAATDADGLEIHDRDVPRDHTQAISMMKKHGNAFCENFTEINASLHKNALYFDDEFIKSVTDAYDPFFHLVLSVDYNAVPILPEQYKDAVSVGRIPRKLVVNLFRKSLGVLPNGQ